MSALRILLVCVALAHLCEQSHAKSPINCNPTCNQDQWCDGSTGKCKQPGNDGDLCSDLIGSGSGQYVQPCVQTATCFQQPDAWRCVVKGDAGDACSTTHRPCKDWFFCDTLNNANGICIREDTLPSAKLCPAKEDFPHSEFCLKATTFCDYAATPPVCTDKKEPWATCPSGDRECARIDPGINKGCRNGYCQPMVDVGQPCIDDEWCRWFSESNDRDITNNPDPMFTDPSASNYNQRSSTCVGSRMPVTSRRRGYTTADTPISPKQNGTCQHLGATGATCHRDWECNWAPMLDADSSNSNNDPDTAANPAAVSLTTDGYSAVHQICLGAYKTTTSSHVSYSGSHGTCQNLRKVGETCTRDYDCLCPSKEFSSYRRRVGNSASVAQNRRRNFCSVSKPMGTICENSVCVDAPTPAPTAPTMPPTNYPTRTPTTGTPTLTPYKCLFNKGTDEECDYSCDCTNGVGLKANAQGDKKPERGFPKDGNEIQKDPASNVYCRSGPGDPLNQTKTCQPPLPQDGIGCMQFAGVRAMSGQPGGAYPSSIYGNIIYDRNPPINNRPLDWSTDDERGGAGYQVNAVGNDVHWMCQGALDNSSICLNTVRAQGRGPNGGRSNVPGYYGTGRCTGKKNYGEACQKPPEFDEYLAFRDNTSANNAVRRRGTWSSPVPTGTIATYMDKELYHAQCYPGGGAASGYCDKGSGLCTAPKAAGEACESHVECGMGLLTTIANGIPNGCKWSERTSDTVVNTLVDGMVQNGSNFTLITKPGFSSYPGLCMDYRYPSTGTQEGSYDDVSSTAAECMVRCQAVIPGTTSFFLKGTQCGCSATTSGSCPMRYSANGYAAYDIVPLMVPGKVMNSTMTPAIVTVYPRIHSEWKNESSKGMLTGVCAPACKFPTIENGLNGAGNIHSANRVSCNPSQFCGLDDTLMGSKELYAAMWTEGVDTNPDPVAFCQTPKPLGSPCSIVDWSKEITSTDHHRRRRSSSAATNQMTTDWGEMLTSGVCAGSKHHTLGWNASAYDAHGRISESDQSPWDLLMKNYEDNNIATGMAACMQPRSATRNVTSPALPAGTRRRRVITSRRRTPAPTLATPAPTFVDVYRPMQCISFKQPGEACEGEPMGTVDDPLYHAQCPIGYCNNATGTPICSVPQVCDWDYECGFWKSCPAADHQKGIQGTCVKQCASSTYCLGSYNADQKANMKCLKDSCLPRTYGTMTHTITINSMTAERFSGWTKLAYQIAYGIAIDIYDVAQKDFKPGCRVDAAAANRRGSSVVFTASLSEAEAPNALSLAQGLAPSSLASSIPTAKTALGSDASSVTTPTSSDFTITAEPEIEYEDRNSDAHDGGGYGSQSSANGDSSYNAGVGGVAGGIVVLLLLCCCCCGGIAAGCYVMKKANAGKMAKADSLANGDGNAVPHEAFDEEAAGGAPAPAAPGAATPSQMTASPQMRETTSISGVNPRGSEAAADLDS